MPVAPFPDVTLFAQVADAQKAQELIGMLKSRAGRANWETTTFNGTEIQFCKVNVGIQLSPAIAIHDGMVIASSKVATLKAVLGQPAKPKSLANDAGFQDVLKKNQGAFFMVARADMSLEKTWGLARPFLVGGLAMIPGEGIDPETVPTVEEMQAELDDIVVYGRVDADGMTLRQSSPLGLTALVATAGALLDWALEQPSVASANPQSRPSTEKKKIY